MMMNERTHLYTVSIYTENTVGLLNRISGIFQRRHVNIKCITASPCEIPEVFRWTILVNLDEKEMYKIIGQIEKQVEVIKAYAHTTDETYFHEACLIKMEASALLNGPIITDMIEAKKIRLVTANQVFCVLEKTGTTEEMLELYEHLRPHGVMQFVRSGRIAVTKDEMRISAMLNASTNEQ